MAITAAFLAIATIIVWWLSHQRLPAKTWLAEGVIGDLPATGPPRVRAAKIGLGVFLAVAGSRFRLWRYAAATGSAMSGRGSIRLFLASSATRHAVIPSAG